LHTPSLITSHSCFQVHCFLLHYLLPRTHFSCAMASEANQTLLATGDAAAFDSKVASGVESDVAPTSSSSNAAMRAIAKKIIPTLHDYWKKLTVTKADRAAYHTADWLPGEVVSSIFDLEFPTVDNTSIVCFESHLIARLSLPPRKFLVLILNFLRCDLIHLHPLPNHILFWY
jgi:hypothetical protein